MRDFSGTLTDLVALIGDQAPGLQAVLTQLNDFLANTARWSGRTATSSAARSPVRPAITDQMRQNARSLTEIVDVGPLLFQNLDNAVSREERAVRLHALADKAVLDGEVLSTFCERIQCGPTAAAPASCRTSAPTSG